MTQEPDQLIAEKYRLVRRLARGGMGTVWLARHLELESDVALKFVRQDAHDDPRAEARFRREARAAAQLKSPHVVQIHDFGFDAGVPYLAMELLEGEDLQDKLDREGRLSLVEAVSIVLAASKGVRAAHEAGVVHRDLKPSNLFLARLGGELTLKVLDFGIARGETSDDSETTTQGLVFGSPAYMSPEQARGAKVDARSDLWSLAAVLYRALVGVPPFEGANSSDVVVKICTVDPLPPSSEVPELGSDVDAFFRQALARDPEQRPQTIEEFVEQCSALNSEIERNPGITPAEPPRGRAEETAPLSIPEEIRTTTRPTLRPSVVPERTPPSTARGRWVLRAFLLALGLGGTWAVHGSTQGETRRTEPDRNEPFLPLREPTRPVEAIDSPPTNESEQEPKASLAPSSSGTTASPPVAPSPKPKKKPSRTKRPQVERQATDPVFGLPVESP